MPPDYGTNLWLSINLSNDTVHLLLHNSQPGVPYQIRSRENLTSGSWFYEETVTGATAVTATPATLSAGRRTNSLFIQALSFTTDTASGTRTAVAISGERIMELTTNGDVVSWGGNSHGELGDYTFLDSSNPVHVVGLTKIAKMASGLNYSLAIDSSGMLWAWGQLESSEDEASVPAQVSGMTNMIAIAAYGREESSDPAVAVKADGTVWMWGMSDCDTYGPSPVQIAGLSNVVSVAAGNCQTFALMTNGTVWTWGNGNEVPSPVSGLSNIVAICAGAYHALALASNGVVWAWGNNSYWQLGDGGSENYSGVPVMVVGLTNAVGIAAGIWHSVAVDAQGRLWAWGDDGWGQLGDDGFAGGASLPFQVPGMSNMVSVAAGSYASAAVDGNGNLWQWGQGSDWPWPYQEWGDENGYPRLSPTYADFYNGQLPDLQILSGNNQLHHASSEFEESLVFKVTDTKGVALSNAPVSVEVIMGDMELRTVSGGDNYKGLRLTTDANGEVSLIGYAEEDVSNPNCRIRVLAASRERVVEADFNEVIVPRPTININNLGDGSVYLVAPNQSLTISVDSQAAPGAFVQEVDYACEINGENLPLGISTQSPFSFAWSNASWWTNAFVGQYILSVVALDNAGGRSDARTVTITVALDSDGNGMPDYWQLRYFGHLGVDPNADPDGDGISNLQEYQYGIDPTDFYNGNLPRLEIVGGNDQAGKYDSFLPQPVSIQVLKLGITAATPMANAPVTFSVTNGAALLAAATNDIPSSSIDLQSDSSGRISVWVYFPPASSNPTDSTILAIASCGTNSIAAAINEFVLMGHWRFDNTNTWVGEAGQLPLQVTNVAGVCSWSSNAVLVDNVTPALLSYNVVETNGNTNINCQVGSVLFWFKPDWSSANVGGSGPGSWGRLLEMGGNDSDLSTSSWLAYSTNGWWALYLSPDGNQLLFGTSTNGGGMTNLTAIVSWYSNEWYQIALTYSPTGSALYVDGRLLANGAGVTCFPNAGELISGFRIGSDQNGNNQAAGAFDELDTFDYPLVAANTYTHGSDIPDWWEVKYFNRAGMDPNFAPAGDAATLLVDYERGADPNVINFSLFEAGQYVSNSTVPVQINIQNGEPFCMAVAVNATNFVIEPSEPFDISTSLIATPWQPFNSNIVVSLNSGEGDYYVWVGLRGVSRDASIAWHGTRLTLDTVPPILMITNPAGSVVSKPVIQLQGCANEFLSSLTYDVSNASGVWTNQTGYSTGQFYDTNLTTFTTNWFQCCNVALTSNGVNLITLHAADLAGNTTTTNIVATFDASADTNPPEFTLVWPQNGTRISGSNFTLQAQVSDPMTAVATSIVDAGGNTNIVQGLVEQNGLVWVRNLPLANGANMLTITAMDSAGNTCVTNLTLFQSGAIVTMNPLAGDQLNQSFVTVTGVINDSSYAITVNDVTATVNPDGTWEADDVPASPSGTAIFDVEVYSGGAPNLVHGNLHFNPMDAPAGEKNGSQLFAATLPAKVGLMSYLYKTTSSGLIAGGKFCAVIPCCGPAFANSGDTIDWTYQGGGLDGGYDYSSGYFGCPPGSPGWIMVSAPKDSKWGFPIPAGRDAYGAPWENILDAQRYVQTRVMIEPQGQIAASTTATYLVQAQAWDLISEGLLGPHLGGQLSPGSIKIEGVPLTDDGTGSGYMLLSVLAGENVDVTPMASGNYTFNVQATELGMQLAVDNNRDGRINFDGSDATSPAKPYRFWINDSKEGGDIASVENQIPGVPLIEPDPETRQSSTLNFALSHVNGRSDVVNFFPVTLQLGEILGQLRPEDGYEYHLYQVDGAVKFVYTSLTRDNAFSYLTDLNSSGYGKNRDEAIMEADTIPVNRDAKLDTTWLARVQDNGGAGVILVEGCAATSHPLMLEIWRNGRLLAGTPLYLSISGVEQMFRQKNLRDSADAPVDLAGDLQVRDNDPSLPTQMSEPINYPDSLSNDGWFFNDRWFVFVVGSNVGGQNARGWESEVFKRMYWSGNKANFVGVSWFGDPFTNNEGVFDYHMAVRNAFATAPLLASFVNSLGGNKTIAGHSLGNGVIVSAIADYGMIVNNACLVDAAFAQECFDGDADDNVNAMRPAAWQDYPEELWAAHWYERFSNDARTNLTWRNRFVGAIGKVYNFYSSTEDVLGKYDGEVPSTTLGAVVASGGHFLNYVWVYQEKAKGNRQDYSPVLGIDILDHFHVGSTYGGWGFNLTDPLLNGDPVWYLPAMVSEGGEMVYDRRVKTAGEIGMVDDTLLTQTQWTPLFKTGWGIWVQGVPTEVVVDASPDYYTGPPWIFNLYARNLTGGDIAADPVKRNQLLAEAIPALSLPVGANQCENILSGRQFNMPAQFADGTRWPSDRGVTDEQIPKWHHSDMDQVAYPYLYKLYNQLVSISNQ